MFTKINFITANKILLNKQMILYENITTKVRHYLNYYQKYSLNIVSKLPIRWQNSLYYCDLFIKFTLINSIVLKKKQSQ